MPISFIHAVLGIGFVLVWVFIGAIIIGDGRFAVRGERESNPDFRATRRLAPPATPKKLMPHGRHSGQRSSAA